MTLANFHRLALRQWTEIQDVTKTLSIEWVNVSPPQFYGITKLNVTVARTEAESQDTFR